MSPQAAAFARDVITRTAPQERERAKNLLWAAGRLADWALPLGLEPVPEVLLHPSAAERFTRSAPGLSGVARRTLRTSLRFIGRQVVPGLYPADLPLPRERSKAPYTPGEISGFLALADTQPTAGRRMRATGLICLGAGAGLIRCDLRDVRGTDVACRSGGVVVTVRGPRPRTVPVLAGYHSRLLAAARFAGDGLVLCGTDPGRRNLTNPLVNALSGGGGADLTEDNHGVPLGLTDRKDGHRAVVVITAVRTAVVAGRDAVAGCRDMGPITDEGVAVGGAFDSDTATGMMPAAQRVAGVLTSWRS